MLILTLIFFCLYLIFVAWLLTGLHKSAGGPVLRHNAQQLPVSVIMAAHNEAEVIGDVLEALSGTDYPTDRFEIIVAADRCTDGTAQVVRDIAARRSANLKLIEISDVPPGISPKKFALQRAIATAQFSHLILMDSDCLPGPNYLNVFNAYLSAGNELVVNIPKLKLTASALHRYLLPERLLTWSIAAAGIGHRRPFLAFGGSWGYTRSLLERAGGFSKIRSALSGDDDLLVHRMGKLQPPMAVCLEPDGWVFTQAPQTIRQFILQRRRHHSAGRYYSPGIQTGYALFHLTNLILWLLPLFYFPALAALLVKMAADLLVLQGAARRFQEKLNLFNFLFFEPLFLLHNLLLAPLGFIGKIRWK